MTRMLITMLLYALATASGSAQNTVSQGLLALSEDQRNAAFTRLLQASDKNCDQVIRTLFVGDGLGLDDWKALCSNRASYSLSIPGEWDASITVLSCLNCRPQGRGCWAGAAQERRMQPAVA
jgi:hypothetical protein